MTALGGLLLTGSSDCNTRAFNDDKLICTFKQDSSVTHLQALTENTFLSVAGTQRSVMQWDIRAPTQSSVKFEAVHYSEIKAIEKLNEEIFVTSALDGIINIWNTRMRKLLTSIVVDETGVSSLKFVQKRGVLLCGHESGISFYSVRDDF